MSITIERDLHSSHSAALPARQVKLGFAGVGWIGRHRMRAIVGAGRAIPVAIYDPAGAACESARGDAPEARIAKRFEELLDLDLDGIVIATPNALHAEQSTAALERGIAVFCQKPLARNAREAREVIAAARSADRLLGVDMSYRHTEGMRRVRDLVARGELGAVYAADLAFHNAYGPDKSWFYDTQLSGGGCLMDLGVHLVDIALWTLGFPQVDRVSGSLYARGRRLDAPADAVEDYAVAELLLETSTVVRIACSWKSPIGADALIEARFHGTAGGAVFRNVNGSFYHFEAFRHQGTTAERLSAPPDDWGGRAALAWVQQLCTDRHFDPGVEEIVHTAQVLDAVYGR